LALAGGATDSIRVTVTGTLASSPPPADTSSRVAPTVTEADVDAALAKAALALGEGFARGQVGEATAATPQFSRFVQEDKPRVDGAPQVQRREFTNVRAEGEVTIPLRWKKFRSVNRRSSVLLHITLALRDGSWQLTAAKNLNTP
jgi:hypothetical protein